MCEKEILSFKDKAIRYNISNNNITKEKEQYEHNSVERSDVTGNPLE